MVSASKFAILCSVDYIISCLLNCFTETIQVTEGRMLASHASLYAFTNASLILNVPPFHSLHKYRESVTGQLLW